MDADLIYVDATDRFLDKLAGVEDPEKEKIYRRRIINIFAEEVKNLRELSSSLKELFIPTFLKVLKV